jgi:hypothetical protein
MNFKEIYLILFIIVCLQILSQSQKSYNGEAITPEIEYSSNLISFIFN